MTDQGNNTSQSRSMSYFNRLYALFHSRNYVIILFTNYTGLFFMAAFIYLNLFFRDVGISYFELGIANSWSLFIGLFGTLFGGYWADKASGKYRLVMATFNKFFAGLALLTIAIATDIQGLLVAWTFFGVGQFCQAALQPLLYESIPPEHLGTGVSLFTLGGIAAIFGLVLVGFLIQDGFVSGLRVFWFLAAISSFIDFILRLFLLKQPHRAQASGKSKPDELNQTLVSQYRTGAKVLIAAIPLFLAVFVLDAISDICYGFASTFFLNEDVGMNYTSINYIMIGATIIGIIGGLFAGSLLDKSENDAKVMFLAYFFLPFSVLLLLFSPNYPKWTASLPDGGAWGVIASTAFIAVVFKAGNDFVWRTIAFGAVGRKLPREHTGKATALLTMIVSLVGAIVMPAAGFIYQETGGTLLLAIAMMLNLAILFLLFAGWTKEPRTMFRPASTSSPA